MAHPEGSAPTPSSGPGRHEARERALGLLYEADTRDLDAEQLLDSLPLEPDPYAVAAVRGVDEARARIDAYPRLGGGVGVMVGHGLSREWPLHRARHLHTSDHRPGRGRGYVPRPQRLDHPRPGLSAVGYLELERARR